MQILDGKALSAQIIETAKEKVAKLKPCLAVVLVGESPASLTYVKYKKAACAKAGIGYKELRYSHSLLQEELIGHIEALNRDTEISGILVQLPLPESMDTPLVIRAIDPKKDVDGFHAYNVGRMFLGAEFEDLPPATPLGIIKLLDHYGIPIQGKEAVVVGHSNHVGKPLSTMLLNRDATVTICHLLTKDLASHTRRADILVVAAGKEKLITADMVKEGAVVVDVGINKRKDGTIRGDVDFEEVAKKASYITPVPGGVGPMTIAALVLNILRAAERQQRKG